MKLTIEVPEVYLMLADKMLALDGEHYEQWLAEYLEPDSWEVPGYVPSDESIATALSNELLICGTQENIMEDVVSDDYSLVYDLMGMAMNAIDKQLLARVIAAKLREPAEVAAL